MQAAARDVWRWWGHGHESAQQAQPFSYNTTVPTRPTYEEAQRQGPVDHAAAAVATATAVTTTTASCCRTPGLKLAHIPGVVQIVVAAAFSKCQHLFRVSCDACARARVVQGNAAHHNVTVATNPLIISSAAGPCSCEWRHTRRGACRRRHPPIDGTPEQCFRRQILWIGWIGLASRGHQLQCQMQPSRISRDHRP